MNKESSNIDNIIAAAEPGTSGPAGGGYKQGLLAVAGAMMMWGFLPIYWKSLIPINSWVIIVYRVLLVCVSALLLAKTKYTWKEIFGPMKKDPKMTFTFFLAGLVITVNWSTYIWAVNSGHILQSSIGYYIEPLVVCLFGVVIFKEKFTRFKTIAVVLATIAIVIQLVHYHQIPGIALGLAVSFAIYSAIKKKVSQPPLLSLVYETFFLAPPALALIVYLEASGRGALSQGEPYQFVLLLFCGLLTVIPLALFAYAAQRVPLFTLGLAEYISPTISMFLGVLLYHEPLDMVLLASLVIIWIGLVFFSIGEYRDNKDKLTS